MKLTIENAPLGTFAPAIGGGHWIKTNRGWKWCTGATFPTPGGDWTGELLAPDQSAPVQQEPNIVTVDDRLTNLKASQLCQQHGYKPTGYILSNANGVVCSINLSNVQWFNAERPFPNAHDVAELVKVLRREFPLLNDYGLDEEKHHCEWSIQQDRKRLHTILAKNGGAA